MKHWNIVTGYLSLIVSLWITETFGNDVNEKEKGKSVEQDMRHHTMDKKEDHLTDAMYMEFPTRKRQDSPRIPVTFHKGDNVYEIKRLERGVREIKGGWNYELTYTESQLSIVSHNGKDPLESGNTLYMKTDSGYALFTLHFAEKCATMDDCPPIMIDENFHFRFRRVEELNSKHFLLPPQNEVKIPDHFKVTKLNGINKVFTFRTYPDLPLNEMHKFPIFKIDFNEDGSFSLTPNFKMGALSALEAKFSLYAVYFDEASAFLTVYVALPSVKPDTDPTHQLVADQGTIKLVPIENIQPEHSVTIILTDEADTPMYFYREINKRLVVFMMVTITAPEVPGAFMAKVLMNDNKKTIAFAETHAPIQAPSDGTGNNLLLYAVGPNGKLIFYRTKLAPPRGLHQLSSILGLDSLKQYLSRTLNHSPALLKKRKNFSSTKTRFQHEFPSSDDNAKRAKLQES